MLNRFELSTAELGQLVSVLPRSGVIILKGDLASGKTTLVKEIVKLHKIDASVTSPTFSVMQSYDYIYHYDIYQSGLQSLISNGLLENFFSDGLHIVEWGDENLISILKKYNIAHLYIVSIMRLKNTPYKRIYEVSIA